MSDEQQKRLAQLRQAYESGILDEETHRAFLAAAYANWLAATTGKPSLVTSSF